MKSGNFSMGVNLIAALTKRVAKTLDDSFDIEIFEMHHNKKIDAPSGTALMFGRAAAEGRGIDLAQHSARGRDGETGARKAGDIGFARLRGGTVVGEHSVIFAGPAERIELVHRAEDRMIFARGALHAAAWARGQKPGLYSMADVLGLRTSSAASRHSSGNAGCPALTFLVTAEREAVPAVYLPRSSDPPVISFGCGRSISSSIVGAISASRPSASARVAAAQQQHRHRIGGVRGVRAAGRRIAHQFAIAVVGGDQQRAALPLDRVGDLAQARCRPPPPP